MSAISKIKARLGAADKESDDICHQRRCWTMSIPARPDDSDIIFGDVTDDLAMLIKAHELMKGALEKMHKNTVCGRAIKGSECPEFCAGRGDNADEYWCDHCITRNALTELEKVMGGV